MANHSNRYWGIGLGVAIVSALLIWLSTHSDTSTEVADLERDAALFGHIQSDGSPVKNALVELLVIAENESLPILIAHVASNALGEYTIPREVLEKAQVFGDQVLLLRVSAEGLASVGRRVQPGRQDFILPKASTRLVASVFDESGKPISNALVRVGCEPLSGESGALVYFSAQTDANGEAVLGQVGMMAARLYVFAEKKGSGLAVFEQAKPKGLENHRIQITLVPGVTLPFVIVDEQEQPAAGVGLKLAEGQGPWATEGKSDAQGRLELTDCPRRDALLMTLTTDHVFAGGYDSLPLKMPASLTEPIRLRVQLAGNVRGQVANAKGTPLSGVRLYLMTKDLVEGSAKNAISDANGSFLISGLRDNTLWRLEARHPNYAPAFVEDVKVGSTQNLKLLTGGTLKGRVEDLRGSPFENVEVYVHQVEKQAEQEKALREFASVRTRADGEWKIEHLNPGVYRLEYRTFVRMKWAAIATKVEHVTLVAEDVHDCGRAQFARGGTLRGVTQPLSRGTLEISMLPHDQGGVPHQAKVQSAKDGIFTIQALPAGKYRFVVRDPKWGFSEKITEVTEGMITDVSFVFENTRVLTGNVKSAKGLAVADARVDAYALTEGQSAYQLSGRAPDNFSGNLAMTRSDGSFELTGLPKGPLTLRLDSRSYGSHTFSVGAQENEFQVVLPPPASLYVDLKDESGKPARGVVVMIEQIENKQMTYSDSAISDASGRAFFTTLPPGNYRARALAEGLPEESVVVKSGEQHQLNINIAAHPSSQ